MARNVIYFDSSTKKIPMAGLVNLPYTDVIVAFLVPDDNFNLVGAGGAGNDDGNLKGDIQALKNAGKNVLVSFGGSGVGSAAYLHWQDHNNIEVLTQQIVN